MALLWLLPMLVLVFFWQVVVVMGIVAGMVTSNCPASHQPWVKKGLHKEGSNSKRKKNRSRHPPSIVNWLPGAKLFQLPPSIYPPHPTCIQSILIGAILSSIHPSCSRSVYPLSYFFYCLASFPFSSFPFVRPSRGTLRMPSFTYDTVITSSTT